MKVRLLRRLGQNPPDTDVDKTPQEAEWLIANGYAIELPADPIEVPVRPAPKVRR